MFNKKGQNIAEYSILIALVIAAAVAMQVYVKRGTQAKIADAVDHAPALTITSPGAAAIPLTFSTKQYEPYYVQSAGNVSSDRDVTENVTANAGIRRNIGTELTQREAGATDNTTWNGEQAR